MFASVPAPPNAAGAGSAPSAASDADEIDRRFDTMISEPPGSEGELTAAEFEEAQRLFLEICLNYLGPVRDLMVELELGDPTKDWLTVCRPSVSSLRRAASDMQLTKLAEQLEALLAAIDEAQRAPGNLLDGPARDALKSAYAKLVESLPNAFSVGEERDRREPMIVLSLLQQVPDVRKVALDRIYAAGLTRLEMFYKARPADIAETAGISLEICERIVARFQRYKRELAAAPATKGARERTQLETLLKRLEQQNNAFDLTSRGWSNAEEKRRLRHERTQTVVEVNLLLARLGELDTIREIERLPFQKKAEHLRQFLAARAPQP